MHSDDLHRAHHLIKTATATETKWPEFHPHCTIAYCKPGMARGYVGDTRFEGKTLTFASLTFSPHTGDRVEIPLTSATQSAAAGVYTASAVICTDKAGQPTNPIPRDASNDVKTRVDDAVIASRLVKLPLGWQTRLAALQTEAGKEGNAPLVNGVNITLSDGRTFSNVKVFDGNTLELDQELAMWGVVITSMTPGVPPQADSPEVLHPHKALTFPTTSAEQQARDAANEAKRKEGQNAAYTDAAVRSINEAIDSACRAKLIELRASPLGVVTANLALAGVSPSNPSSPMDLTTLKQSLAAVKTVEELPTAIANVALFADAIAKASETLAAERTAAQDAAKAAQASVDQIKADLAALTKTHNEIVAAQQVKAAQDAFDAHMAAVEAAFDLDDEVRAEIVDEVKAATTDEAFAKWMTSAKKKMKGFMKKKADDKGEPDADDAKAALAAKTALASAAAAPVDPAHTHDFAATATLSEQMQATFAANVKVHGVKVKDLTSKK